MNLSGRNVFILGAVIFILIVAIVFIPKYQSAIYLSKVVPDLTSLEAKDRVTVLRDVELYENSARTTLAQIVGGLVILLGLYFTYLNSRIAQDNLRVTEEGKLTDRFSKAVEMLGSEKLDVRLGGIYALERIARDSQKDHWTVMEVLTAFVRENAPYYSEGQETPQTHGISKPREDIQTIMTVIGRRKWSEIETQNLNLQRTYLAGCNLGKGNFSKANFDKSNLREAILSGADFSKANLSNTDFKDAILYHADLSQTWLTEANLSGANLISANLNFTDLNQADLSDAKLFNADVNFADFSSVKFLNMREFISARNFENALMSPKFRAEVEKLQAKQTAEKQN